MGFARFAGKTRKNPANDQPKHARHRGHNDPVYVSNSPEEERNGSDVNGERGSERGAQGETGGQGHRQRIRGERRGEKWRKERRATRTGTEERAGEERLKQNTRTTAESRDEGRRGSNGEVEWGVRIAVGEKSGMVSTDGKSSGGGGDSFVGATGGARWWGQ